MMKLNERLIMSDELAIQQQKQGSATPYALGGAVVGGLAGAFSPVGVTKPKYSSYEDILKESEDTFNREISKGGDNKGFWETAKSHANAVQNAEKEYESQVAKIREQSKSAVGQLPADNKAAQELKAAEEAYTKAIEAKKAELATQRKVPASVTGFMSPDDALGNGVFKNTKIQNEYTNLYKGYMEALENAETNSLNRRKLGTYENVINEFFNDLARKTNEGKDVGKNDLSELCKRLKNKGVIPEGITEITDFSDFKAKGYRSEKAYKEAYEKSLNEAIENLAKEILGDTKEITVQGSKGKGRTIKVYTNANGYRNSLMKKESALADLQKDIANKINTRKTNGKPLMAFDRSGNQRTDFAADFKLLLSVEEYNKLLEMDKIKKNDALKGQINILKGFAERKEKAERDFAESTKKFFGELSIAKKLNKAANQEIADKTKNERGKLIGFINRNKLNATTKEATAAAPAMTEEEIAKKAKEAVDKLDVKTKLEAAKANAEKAASEAGLTAKELTDDELLKILKEKGLGSKEEYLAKVKKSAQEAIEKDLGKIKGPNKWVNAAIAAAALGLVGLGIGKAVNK